MTRRRRGGFCDGWDGASTPAGQNRARRGPRVGGAAEVGGGKPTQAKTGLKRATRRSRTVSAVREGPFSKRERRGAPPSSRPTPADASYPPEMGPTRPRQDSRPFFSFGVSKLAGRLASPSLPHRIRLATFCTSQLLLVLLYLLECSPRRRLVLYLGRTSRAASLLFTTQTPRSRRSDANGWLHRLMPVAHPRRARTGGAI